MKTKRFVTLLENDNYALEHDTFNNTYIVMKKCYRFRQQVSKTYYYLGCARRYYYYLTYLEL